MANTRDILGDRETMEALIEDRLEEFEDSDIGTLSSNAFKYHRALRKVVLPNIINMNGSDTFEYAEWLETLEAPNLRTIGSYTFNYCQALTEVNFDKLTSLGSYVFMWSGVGSVILPVCTYIGTEPFRYSRVGTADFYKKLKFSGGFLDNAYHLTQLILRSDEMCTLSSELTVSISPLRKGIGWIYVPNALLNDYKKAEHWSDFADHIVSIDEYPKALQDETIEDSWEEIFASIDNGSYINKYDIGHIKYVNVGGTWLAMEIAAIDKDILPNGNVAPITWISREILQDCIYDRPSNRSSSWATSDVRSFLRNKIYPLIDPVVRNRILEVTKVTNNGSTATNTTETVWIPSYREMIGDVSVAYCEQSGVDYVNTYSTSDRRMKKNGPALTYGSDYLLRTAQGDSLQSGSIYIRAVASNGYQTTSSSTGRSGLVIGFCT